MPRDTTAIGSRAPVARRSRVAGWGPRMRGRRGPGLALMLALATGLACATPAASPAPSPSKPSGATGVAPAAPGAAAPAASAPAAAPAPVTLNYGATTLGWNIAPENLAQEKGFYAAENLTVDINITGQSAAVCQAILARAVEIGSCSLNDTIQTVEASGAPLVVIMQQTVTSLHNGLIARPELAGYADLRGKTVMLGGPKDNTVYFFRTMARANGVRDDDYDVTYAGSSSARYAALQAGGVAATLLTDPFDYRAEQEGMRRFDNLRPKYISPTNYAGNGPIVLRDWAQANPDVAERYVRAMLHTIAWIYDPANKEELFAILGPRLNVTRDVFDRSYERSVVEDKEWSTDGRALASAYEGVLKSLVELGVLPEPAPPPTKYFDMTYVDRVHQRGLR